MNLRDRYLHKYILQDLKDKMVFIGGPRQVGKTTLAKIIAKSDFKYFAYLNWDNFSDRRKILNFEIDPKAQLIIYDEVHKYNKWKVYLKGQYDNYRDRYKILVTGSARLDIYRRGGDSLMGRYRHYRLHPFSQAEVNNIVNDFSSLQKFVIPVYSDKNKNFHTTFSRLYNFGGFPEPFLKRNYRELRRFHNERIELLVREDIRDLSVIRDLSGLSILTEIIPDKVSSLLSINSLSHDLEVSFKTVGLWLDILERLYFHFRLYPYVSKKIRSLKKTPKIYLWDWSMVDKNSARLENIVASHLLKFIHYLYDVFGWKAELYFLRDKEGREVDFLVVIDKKPYLAVEVKETAGHIDSSLYYFRDKLDIPYVFQVVGESGVDYVKNNIRVISAEEFLTALV